jgi:hypothetical protein
MISGFRLPAKELELQAIEPPSNPMVARRYPALFLPCINQR